MSNAALRSSKTSNEMQPWPDARSMSFVILASGVSVLWWGLKPDCILHRYHFFARRSTIKQTTFSKILDVNGRFEMVCNLPVQKDLVLVS